MKRLLLILGIVFVLLTFAGAGYVLLSNGKVNAGFAVVPMIIALAFVTLWRNMKSS